MNINDYVPIYHKQWVSDRINFIKKMFPDNYFKDKSILELGSCWGDIGGYFSLLGADVTMVNGFDFYYEACKNRFPNVKNIKHDCDSEWIYDDHYDVIFHMGLLYHLRDPKKSLIECQKHCDIMILETVVSDFLDFIEIIPRTEDINLCQDQGLNAEANFSADFVEKYLINYTRYDDSSLNGKISGNYNWTASGNSGFRGRRFWICDIKNQLSNLTNSLLKNS